MPSNKKNKNIILTELELIKEEVRNDVTGPVIASFGFIIALIWRDAIQSVIHEFLSRTGLTKDAYIYQIILAIIVTIVAVTVMVVFTRIKQKKRTDKVERLKRKLK